jgi:hypothetical protein
MQSLQYQIHSPGFRSSVWPAAFPDGDYQSAPDEPDNEINATDRYAVIEPAVRHVQLKPEVLKRGLNYPTASVGPSCSVLANFVASGDHHVQHSFSRVSRYLLGVEWVLPTGEILRVGSLGSDAGWFCADGPGPSLRGLVRGWGGWAGGLGIIPKSPSVWMPESDRRS